MNDSKALERTEIIAALRCCQAGNCRVCLYRGRGIACRNHLMSDAADLLEQDAAPNDPLTLEELRGMSNTDWVWVIFPQLQPEENCWYRAKKLYDLYSHAHYGETWLAYRRKPDGGGE